MVPVGLRHLSAKIISHRILKKKERKKQKQQQVILSKLKPYYMMEYIRTLTTSRSSSFFFPISRFFLQFSDGPPDAHCKSFNTLFITWRSRIKDTELGQDSIRTLCGFAQKASPHKEKQHHNFLPCNSSSKRIYRGEASKASAHLSIEA